MRINRNHHIALRLTLSLASAGGGGGCGAEPAPAVSRVWPAMGTMMSAAAWGGGSAADSSRVAAALNAAHDSVERIDSLTSGHARIAALDSVQREIALRTGVQVPAESLASGYALDRAAVVLAPLVDSALLDLGGQYRWIGPPGRDTRRSVGIPDPENSLDALGIVELRRGSIRTQTQSPERRGVGAARSVTVLAGDALTAHAWSLAFFAVGCDSAFAVVRRLGGDIDVVCADAAGVRWTPDLGKRVRVPEASLPARAP